MKKLYPISILILFLAPVFGNSQNSNLMEREKISTTLIKKLEDAWNNANGEEYAEVFTDDASFVDIRGGLHNSRISIAKGHQAIFNTIYKGSLIEYNLIQCTNVSDDIIVSQVESTLDSPDGPLKGIHKSIFTFIAIRHGDDWKIKSLQNTLVMASK